MGARGGVGKQLLDVAGAHLAAVDAVGRSAVAFDAPRYFELVGIVERGGGAALTVVEVECHLGDAAPRPLGGAVEYNVVHLSAAQAFGRCLAHHPTHRLDQVRLATAVRADDAREARHDQELGRLDK